MGIFMKGQSKGGRKSPKKKKGKGDGGFLERIVEAARGYEFSWWHLVTALFLAFLVWASTYKEERREYAPRRSNGYEDFSGYDPERGLEGVSHIDLENRTISYYDGYVSSEKRKDVPIDYGGGPGTVVYDRDGNPHSIDTTPEDILEQLRDEIDFDDLADDYDYDGEW